MFEQDSETTYKCPKCGSQFATLAFSNRDYRIPLYLGAKLYACEVDPESDDFQTAAGELVENKLKAGMLGIKNTSEKTWRAKMPDGVFYEIPPEKGFPIWDGLEIEFGTVKANI